MKTPHFTSSSVIMAAAGLMVICAAFLTTWLTGGVLAGFTGIFGRKHAIDRGPNRLDHGGSPGVVSVEHQGRGERAGDAPQQVQPVVAAQPRVPRRPGD